jgi:antitoxin MazE
MRRVMRVCAWKRFAEQAAFSVNPLRILESKERWDFARSDCKRGNSLALRIPRAIAKKVGLDEGANVEVRASGRDLVLAPAHREYSLQELVAGITPKNRHRETNWGAPVGNEYW